MQDWANFEGGKLLEMARHVVNITYRTTAARLLGLCSLQVSTCFVEKIMTNESKVGHVLLHHDSSCVCPCINWQRQPKTYRPGTRGSKCSSKSFPSNVVWKVMMRRKIHPTPLLWMTPNWRIVSIVYVFSCCLNSEPILELSSSSSSNKWWIPKMLCICTWTPWYFPSAGPAWEVTRSSRIPARESVWGRWRGQWRGGQHLGWTSCKLIHNPPPGSSKEW